LTTSYILYWNNGSSFEPYSPQFNNGLKRKIRERDNYTCQECLKSDDDLKLEGKDRLGRRKNYLTVHHIDYDKKNCNWDNLLTLCNPCNLKANHNREYWEKHFKQKMKQ